MVYERFIELLKKGHKGALEAVELTKLEITENLRKELRSIEPILPLLITSAIWDERYKKTPFYTGSSGHHCYASEDGEKIVNYFWTPTETRLGLWDRVGKEYVWTRGYGAFVNAHITWNPVVNRILTYEDWPTAPRGRIREYSIEDGSLLRELTSTVLGPIGRPYVEYLRNICYDLEDPENKFWMVDPENHVLLRVAWDGTVDKQFGEYGVPGTDDTHLDTPASVSQASGPFSRERIAVADNHNHRILIIHVGYTPPIMEFRLPYPWPGCSYVWGSSALAIWSGIDPTHPTDKWRQMGYGFFILYDYTWPNPQIFIPHIGGCFMVPHPSEFGKVIVDRWFEGLGEQVFELDLRKHGPQYVTPVSVRLLQGESVGAGETIYTPPIVGWFRPKQIIFVKSDQTFDLVVQVPKYFGVTQRWDGTWEEYDRISDIAAGVYPYIPSKPLNIFRLGITPAVAATIDSWGELSPWAGLSLRHQT